MKPTFVVIPNWNGRKDLSACLDSLKFQSPEAEIIVVDNGSSDGSVELVREKYPSVELICFGRNTGFAAAVNAGITSALERDAKYIALLNNDALADKNWLKNLVATLDSNNEAGIATSKILDKTRSRLDSTGEVYSVWGLPFPRGRNEPDIDKYDARTEIFAASGGASLYRADMLRQIGLFDSDFFAYYEDVDVSFRAQLAGWKVKFEPKAVVYHSIGETSRKIPGFTTYQTLKNLPLLMWKNVPWALMPKVFPRFVLAYFSIYFSAVARGQFVPATKGLLMSIVLWPKKLFERRRIQSLKKVDADYIDSMFFHDLPPNAKRLHSLRRIITLGLKK